MTATLIFEFPEVNGARESNFRFPNIDITAGPDNILALGKAVNRLQARTASAKMLETRTSILNP